MAKNKHVEIEAKIKLAGLDVDRVHSLAFSPLSLLTYLLLKEKAVWSDFERVFVKNRQIHVTKQTLNKYLKQCLNKNIIVKFKDEKTGRYYYKLNDNLYLKILNSAAEFYSQLYAALIALQHELTRMAFAVKIKKIQTELKTTPSISYIDHCLTFGADLNSGILKKALNEYEKIFKEFKNLFTSQKIDATVVFSEIELNEIINIIVDTMEKTILMLMRAANHLKLKGKIPPEEISPLENQVLKLDAEIQKMKREIKELTKSEETARLH
jgi:predicted transcriptional regulator